MKPLTFAELLSSAAPAGLGPEARDSRLGIAEIDAALKDTLPSGNRAVRDLFRATIYLWHDHLDASHKIAQDIETADGSLVHAIVHRREPDYWNSKYWFRRVGKHPAFLKLAIDAEELLKKTDETDLLSRLVPNKTWDPFAFVDAVEDALKGQFRSKVPVLEQLQKLEFQALLESLASRA